MSLLHVKWERKQPFNHCYKDQKTSFYCLYDWLSDSRAFADPGHFREVSTSCPSPPPVASSAQLCYLLINHGDRRLAKWLWIIQETFGSDFSPQFPHLIIYLSYSWGCVYKQMDLFLMHQALSALPSSRIFQPCSPPQLEEKPWHKESARLVWHFLFWNQVALHNPQNPWFDSDWQITSWKTGKSRRKLGH